MRSAEDAGIAVIHQELTLVHELTVAENLFLGRLAPTRILVGLVDDDLAPEKCCDALKSRLIPKRRSARWGSHSSS